MIRPLVMSTAYRIAAGRYQGVSRIHHPHTRSQAYPTTISTLELRVTEDSNHDSGRCNCAPPPISLQMISEPYQTSTTSLITKPFTTCQRSVGGVWSNLLRLLLEPNCPERLGYITTSPNPHPQRYTTCPSAKMFCGAEFPYVSWPGTVTERIRPGFLSAYCFSLQLIRPTLRLWSFQSRSRTVLLWPQTAADRSFYWQNPDARFISRFRDLPVMS
ncbi:hypothetical protein C8Q80DRAFT_821931 [Daedaleopsis nitida]|nr:hypothetical protein C8Q80DRAFT_821931 [Daedaleopsis nitida]